MEKRQVRKTMGVALALLVLVPTIIWAEDPFGWQDFLEIKELVETGYYKEVDESVLLEGAAKGLFEYLDEYSHYYTEQEFRELQASLTGSQVGIGIYLTEDQGQTVVLAPIEGGAADRAGLRSGDIIERIDDQDLEGLAMDQVLDLLVGEEESYISLLIRRGKRSLPFYIQRETMRLEAVHHSLIDGVGYIEIDQFVDGVGDQVGRILDDFDSQGVDRLILDLRDNPGGYLNEALEVANKIIPQGPVVKVKYRAGEKEHGSQASFKKPKYQLVVLVNGGSASASEIVAGAVKDRKLGTIVGSRTYGKSKVQEIVFLRKGGLKLTTAEYFTPSGVSIGGKGISPHIEILPEGDTLDRQLERALEIFQK